ncbi:prepilin peptidase [Salibacterium aidingense]|uniref:prepilin peptidase n=1 Tax=Salibacterium aidingense TaxID=384933 RepID=UPI00047E97AF|nr:prepilin peptidase [Salibacterium aidingense]
MMYVAVFLLTLTFGLSLYTDMKRYKIKNVVTLPTSLAGILCAPFFVPPLQFGLYLILLMGIGYIGWNMGLWKAGDTKLMLASGVWMVFIIGPSMLFVLFYYLAFIVLHLCIGHFLGLKKYRFNLKQYLLGLRTKVNETFGTIPGTFLIMCSFFISFFIYK